MTKVMTKTEIVRKAVETVAECYYFGANTESGVVFMLETEYGKSRAEKIWNIACCSGIVSFLDHKTFEII